MNVKASFIGRLGADAEVVTLPQQAPFISFRAAVNERISKEDVTTWMTVTADYSRYQNMAKYLLKGSVVHVSGTERCSLYTSKSGTPGIDRKVNADCIEFVNLGRKEGEAGVATVVSVNANTAAQMTTGTLHSTTPQPAPAVAAATVAAKDDDQPF